MELPDMSLLVGLLIEVGHPVPAAAIGGIQLKLAKLAEETQLFLGDDLGASLAAAAAFLVALLLFLLTVISWLSLVLSSLLLSSLLLSSLLLLLLSPLLHPIMLRSREVECH